MYSIIYFCFYTQSFFDISCRCYGSFKRRHIDKADLIFILFGSKAFGELFCLAFSFFRKPRYIRIFRGSIIRSGERISSSWALVSHPFCSTRS